MKTGLARFLTYILRHKPCVASVELDAAGWVDVSTLIKQLKLMDYDIDTQILKHIVESDLKKRFSFSDDLSKIRASQGHSICVDLGLSPSIPPDILYHGTVESSLDGIFSLGLKKLKRHAVHLSHEISTALDVGGRRGEPVILVIDSLQMYIDGFEFFISDNGVWLVDRVDSKYIKRLSY